MDKNVYLKLVEEKDIDKLIKYNEDYKQVNEKGWVSEDRFTNLLKMCKESCNDSEKVHFIPYWLFVGDDVVGHVILNLNTDVDEVWREYGGNISYSIAPSYRYLGYGTKALSLALLECKKMGLESALVTCNEDNIGSRKVIENNNGIYKDSVKDKYDNDELLRRYIVKSR